MNLTQTQILWLINNIPETPQALIKVGKWNKKRNEVLQTLEGMLGQDIESNSNYPLIEEVLMRNKNSELTINFYENDGFFAQLDVDFNEFLEVNGAYYLADLLSSLEFGTLEFGNKGLS